MIRSAGVYFFACLMVAAGLGCQQSSSDEWRCAGGASFDTQSESQSGADGPATTATTGSATSTSISAARVEFGRAFGEAVELGRKQAKPMMVFFGAKWCRFCKAMEEESFRDPAVVELSKQFVCVAVDVDLEPGVCHDFGVNTLPTVLFTSASGIPMNRQVGETSAQYLRQQMEAALQADIARHQIEGNAVRR